MTICSVERDLRLIRSEGHVAESSIVAFLVLLQLPSVVRP